MTADASLTDGVATPRLGSSDFVSDEWQNIRDSGIPALHQSVAVDDPVGREEFLTGARLLGVHGRRKELVAQQLLLADVLNAGDSTVAVLMPRRSTKSTSLLVAALGRCASREDYVVAYTQCTTGTKARERFRKDVIMVLERLYPEPEEWRIFKAAGQERIEFKNGSILQVLVPSSEAFRGDAYDMVILDEAGEASPEMSEDLMQGLLPTFDTRPDAQLVVAGTAAKFRDGNLLWSTLEDGRHSRGGTGILEYAAPDTTDETDLDDWEKVEALVLAAHPGIGNLTTLKIVRERWEKLSRRQFAEEYLSIFGTVGAVSAFINIEAWTSNGRQDALPAMPLDRAVGLAVSVHPDQSCSVIAAAWRDDLGKACVGVIEYRSGSNWIPKRAKELATKLRTSILYDDVATSTKVEVEVMERMRPRPRLAPQGWADVSTAAALFMKENEEGNLVHWDQPELNEAVALVTKRGTAKSSRWAFGRAEWGQSIIAAEAAALALRWVDENPRRAALRPKMAS